jgi:hypothetical protein
MATPEQRNAHPQPDPTNPHLHLTNYLSYWIFIWAVIYIIIDWGIKKNHLRSVAPVDVRPHIESFLRNCNPIIALVVAVIFATCSLVVLIARQADGMVVFLYTLVNFCIKVIPIYLLINTPIKPFNNILSFIVLIVVYHVYLSVRGMNIYDFYKKEGDNAFNGNTPIVRQILDLLQK